MGNLSQTLKEAKVSNPKGVSGKFTADGGGQPGQKVKDGKQNTLIREQLIQGGQNKVCEGR